jgi:hypothetical protein
MYYNAKQTQYRDFAVAWSKLNMNETLSERQQRGMVLFFTPIARRFGLVQEFKSLGLI